MTSHPIYFKALFNCAYDTDVDNHIIFAKEAGQVSISVNNACEFD